MYIAFSKVKIKRVNALIGFMFSMIILFFEVFILQYVHFIREYDIYFALVPVTFFLFCFAIQTGLPDKQIFKTLRALSSLIFYSHLWINEVVSKGLKIIYEPLRNTCVQFVLTLFITIIGSLVVMKLSEIQKFKWLKNFIRKSLKLEKKYETT